MKLRTIFIAAVCLMAGAAAQAQNTYDSKDKWYLQLQGGTNLTFAEYDHGKSANLAVSAAVGKHITPIWGARVQMLWGTDKNVVMEDTYRFKHNSFYAVATFDILNAIRGTKVGDERRFTIDLIAGPGVIQSYGFKDTDKVYINIDAKGHVSPALLAGISATYSVSKRWGINLDVLGNAQHESINGIVGHRYLEGHLNVLAGIRYNF